MEDCKKFYVTYGSFYDGRYHLNNMDVEVYVRPDISQGMLAHKLEDMVSSILDDQTVMIINFWEM